MIALFFSLITLWSLVMLCIVFSYCLGDLCSYNIKVILYFIRLLSYKNLYVGFVLWMHCLWLYCINIFITELFGGLERKITSTVEWYFAIAHVELHTRCKWNNSFIWILGKTSTVWIATFTSFTWVICLKLILLWLLIYEWI